MNLFKFAQRRPAGATVPPPSTPPLYLENLRERGWGELLDAALWLYRNQLGTYLGIVFLAQIPVTALQTLATALFFNVRGSSVVATQMVTMGLASSNLFFVFLNALAQMFATVAIIHTVAHIYFGQPLGLIEAYRLTFKKAGRWIGTTTLMGTFTVIFLCATLVPCVGLGLFFFGAILIGPLTLPVAVLEPIAVTQIPQRAWHLVRRRFWWGLGYTGVLSLFSTFFAASPLLFFNVLLNNFVGDMVAYNSAAQLVWQTLLQNLTQQLFTALFLPLSIICYTLLYFDLRTRTEGLDLALRAQLLHTAPSTPALSALSTTPRPVAQKLITQQEVGYFALLGFIGFGLYMVFFLSIMLFGVLLVRAVQ